jgi:hypothetical protein
VNDEKTYYFSVKVAYDDAEQIAHGRLDGAERTLCGLAVDPQWTTAGQTDLTCPRCIAERDAEQRRRLELIVEEA